MLNVMKPRLSGKKLLFVLFTLFTLTAFGQGAEPAIGREGFMIGFGIGGGVISVSESNQEVPFDKASGGISLPNLYLEASAFPRFTTGYAYFRSKTSHAFGEYPWHSLST